MTHGLRSRGPLGPRTIVAVGIFAFVVGGAHAERRAAPSATRAAFGALPDGSKIDVVTLKNTGGMEVRAITYGAILTSILVADRTGRFDDVVAGHDDIDGYLNHSRFFGAVVGRYGNRIAKGKFPLNGREYTLAVNNGPNHLHGGVRGFDKVTWALDSKDVRATPDTASVTFSYVSPDGEEGYPGTLTTRVTYTLTNRNELTVAYHATTTKATPINLTQHSYFNLGGFHGQSVIDHVLTVNALSYTPVDPTMIPTGELAGVAGTPFDFRTPMRLGARIEDDYEQLKLAGGYDHNFVLTRAPGAGLQLAARLEDPASGRVLEVRTTEPGLQLNTANKLDKTYVGKRGAVYDRRSAVCLETQHFPDSPNHPAFPSTIVRPNDLFRSTTIYAFSVKRP